MKQEALREREMEMKGPEGDGEVKIVACVA
jgi:hypothetical protein